MIILIPMVVLGQQGPYFARTFPVPTGNNGWEEYTMALDLIMRADVRRSERKLDQQRPVVASYSRAYQLVEAGNRKALSYPWIVDAIEDDDRDPGLRFIELGIAMAYRVPVLAADGHPEAAADALLNAFAFADRTSDPTLSNALVGAVAFSASFRELSALLPKLDLVSAHKLSVMFDRFVKEPQPLVRTYLSDIDLDIAYLPKWFDGSAEIHDTEHWDVPEGFSSLTSVEKARYVPLIRAEFAKHKEQIKAMVAREERFWSFEPTPHPDPIVNYALDNLLTSQVSRSAVRVRTQFRLAALHCRVIEFKRKHNSWPEKLEELGGREVWYDPASGGPFFYAKLTEQVQPRNAAARSHRPSLSTGCQIITRQRRPERDQSSFALASE